MKKSYELFLEKSGLSVDQANIFLEMKYRQLYPPKTEADIDMEFIDKLAKEAKEWKK